MPWKDPEKKLAYMRARSKKPAVKVAVNENGKRYHARQKLKPTSDPVRARRIARATAWNKAHPEKVRAYHWRAYRRRQYGLTEPDFWRLFENQEGLCGVCSRLMCNCGSQKCASRVVVDHDHSKTGRDSVRGLLCDRCNSCIGRLNDSARLCRNAAGYLEGS
jgi:hypothetical protein